MRFKYIGKMWLREIFCFCLGFVFGLSALANIPEVSAKVKTQDIIEKAAPPKEPRLLDGVVEVTPESFNRYVQAAKEGDAKAQYLMGLIWETGWGGSTN